MQCRRIPKQLLIERYYRVRERLLNAYCKRQTSELYESYGVDSKQTRNLGVNCYRDKSHFLGNGYLLPDYSTHLRKLNAIKRGRGTTQFSALLLNDYGKIEGSPGGFGSSPKNRF